VGTNLEKNWPVRKIFSRTGPTTTAKKGNFLKCTLLCPFTNPVRERHYSQDSQVLAGQSIKDAGVLIARGRGKVSARNENNLLYWTD
jgi:hypothetical protein